MKRDRGSPLGRRCGDGPKPSGLLGLQVLGWRWPEKSVIPERGKRNVAHRHDHARALELSQLLVQCLEPGSKVRDSHERVRGRAVVLLDHVGDVELRTLEISGGPPVFEALAARTAEGFALTRLARARRLPYEHEGGVKRALGGDDGSRHRYALPH